MRAAIGRVLDPIEAKNTGSILLCIAAVSSQALQLFAACVRDCAQAGGRKEQSYEDEDPVRERRPAVARSNGG
jgi:hypothetical protein